MERAEAETINVFAKRSSHTVNGIAIGLAIGGALADILGHALPGLFGTSGGVGLLWGLWIPLCFVTIPPIHYLCRQVVSLRERVEALEGRAGRS